MHGSDFQCPSYIVKIVKSTYLKTAGFREYELWLTFSNGSILLQICYISVSIYVSIYHKQCPASKYSILTIVTFFREAFALLSRAVERIGIGHCVCNKM